MQVTEVRETYGKDFWILADDYTGKFDLLTFHMLEYDWMWLVI